jgi:hypothetical protein
LSNLIPFIATRTNNDVIKALLVSVNKIISIAIIIADILIIKFKLMYLIFITNNTKIADTIFAKEFTPRVPLVNLSSLFNKVFKIDSKNKKKTHKITPK